MNDFLLTIIDEEGNIYEHPKDGTFHIMALGDFIKNKYDEEIDLSNRNANTLAIDVKNRDNIVILNVTTYIKGKPLDNEKDCIIILPDNVTNIQLEAYNNFFKKLKTYSNITIWYDFTDTYRCKTLCTKNKKQVPGILNDSLNLMNVLRKTK